MDTKWNQKFPCKEMWYDFKNVIVDNTETVTTDVKEFDECLLRTNC